MPRAPSATYFILHFSLSLDVLGWLAYMGMQQIINNNVNEIEISAIIAESAVLAALAQLCHVCEVVGRSGVRDILACAWCPKARSASPCLLSLLCRCRESPQLPLLLIAKQSCRCVLKVSESIDHTLDPWKGTEICHSCE